MTVYSLRCFLGRTAMHDGAGHARADQYARRHIIDTDAHRDPPDPLESRIRIDEEFGAGGIVGVGVAWLMAMLPGSASRCSRAARLGVSPTTASSCVAPRRSDRRPRPCPVAMLMRAA